MCSKMFGSSSGGDLGLIGDVVGGLAGSYFGPVGAALGAEAGGTLGGVAGGESVGTAAGNALVGAGVAGVGDYAAESFGGATAGGGDLFGVSGTPAAPSATSAASTAMPLDGSGSNIIAGDNYSNIDPSTGQPVQSSSPSTLANVTGSYAPSPLTSASGNVPGNIIQGGGSTAGGGAANTGTGWTANVASSLGIPQNSVLPAGIAGIGLAKDLLTPSTLQGQSQLNSEASTLASQSQTMMNYLNNGTLPPGVQTSINNATAGAQAAIRSKYAQMGLSGSSMEQQELNQVNLNASSAGATTAIALYNTGATDANISQQIYHTLLTTDAQQQAATGNAIANMAAALAGGGAYRPAQNTTQPAQVG